MMAKKSSPEYRPKQPNMGREVTPPSPASWSSTNSRKSSSGWAGITFTLPYAYVSYTCGIPEEIMHVRRWLSLTVVLIASLLVFAACSKKNKTEKEEAADQAAPVEAEAPRIVVAMIDAHGGMPGWRLAKTLAFTNEFQMADDSVTTSSRVTVDLAQRRAYVDFGDSGESMVWDGKKTWGVHWT